MCSVQKEKSGRGGGGGVNSINLYKRKHVICNILELHHHLFFFLKPLEMIQQMLGLQELGARTCSLKHG